MTMTAPTHAGPADTRTAASRPRPDGPAAEVVGLVKRYGTAAQPAVDGATFHVEPGEVFGLLGPNGAGKTTTLECLVGQLRPTAGTVRVLGLDPVADARKVKRLVAVQPQEASLFPRLTVGETVELWASFYCDPAGRAAADTRDVVERVGLRDAERQQVHALSGGQRRRLLLAVTLVGRPRLLVLDEPAAGLDPQAREHLWDAIGRHREDGGTVLMTTHDMNEAGFCDRVAVMVAGRVAAHGTPRELVTQLKVPSAVTFRTARADAAERLRHRQEVDAVTTTGHAAGEVTVRIQTRRLDETLRFVAGSPALAATELSVTQGGLDEVFRMLAKGDRP